MSAPVFISRGISYKGKAAVVSIAVSFAAMIIAVAVSGGFRKEIRSTLSAVAGDISIMPVNIRMDDGDDLFRMNDCMLSGILSVEGVDRLRPVLYKAAVVRNGDDIQGVVFRGEERSGDASDMNVTIPRSLARTLDLAEGDKLTAYMVGEDMVIRNTVVDGIYDDIVTPDGHMVVNCNIAMLRRVMKVEDAVSAYEVMLKPSYKARDRAAEVSDMISYLLYSCSDEDTRPLRASTLAASYPQLFDWLGLIDSNMALVLVLMTVVAAFNMIVGLLILLFEHISTIGLLKAMGMPFKGIAATFLLTTAKLVAWGILAGNAVALTLCLVQAHTHILALNPENYFVSFVPVDLNVASILVCDVLSFAAIMLVMLIPCRFIAGIQPSTTLVSE